MLLNFDLQPIPIFLVFFYLRIKLNQKVIVHFFL